MSPYRTIPERDVAAEKPARRLPMLAIVLALLGAVRMVGALVTRESCGTDAGLAMIVMLLAGHAILTER